MFKVFIFAIICFTIVNGNVKDDLKEKVSEALHQGEKVKERVVNVVNEGVANAKTAASSAADAINENVDTLKDKAAETLKAGQKVAENVKEAAGKKFDEAKKAGEQLTKKASGSVEDLREAAGDAAKTAQKAASDAAKTAQKAASETAKTAQKVAENVANEASKQGEKLKRQASDTGEKVKSAAKEAKKQVEKRTDGLGDKLFHVLIDVKNSILETLGLASKAAADLTDQAKSKFDEVSFSAKKTAEKAKKKVKDAVDL